MIIKNFYFFYRIQNFFVSLRYFLFLVSINFYFNSDDANHIELQLGDHHHHNHHHQVLNENALNEQLEQIHYYTTGPTTGATASNEDFADTNNTGQACNINGPTIIISTSLSEQVLNGSSLNNIKTNGGTVTTRNGGSLVHIDNMKPLGSCDICGDKGSGYHYSVYSCEGCKGFFKRTVQKDLQYKCRGYQQCVINKLTRNQCQYCRFQKCMMAGMKREAVREDRTPSKCNCMLLNCLKFILPPVLKFQNKI